MAVGELVPRDTPVIVTEVHGNRVVVKRPAASDPPGPCPWSLAPLCPLSYGQARRA